LDLPSIWQVTLGWKHMSNLFKRFQALIPTYPLRVGDVIAYDNGVATIQEQSGAWRRHVARPP
jgi:hypothetical protein